MVAEHPHFRWVRPVQQARSQLTLDRLLDSAEALIAEKGFADVPVADIAHRAGVSVGAFYSRFRDKEALLHCLQDRFVAEARATADAALEPERWRGASIAEIGREAIAFMVEIHRERAGILREILGRAHTDPEIVKRKEQLIAYICERLQLLLLERRQEISHPDPDTIVCAGRGCPVAADQRSAFAGWECSRLETLCDCCGHVLWRLAPGSEWVCIRCEPDRSTRRQRCPKVLLLEKGGMGSIPPRRRIEERGLTLGPPRR